MAQKIGRVEADEERQGPVVAAVAHAVFVQCVDLGCPSDLPGEGRLGEVVAVGVVGIEPDRRLDGPVHGEVLGRDDDLLLPLLDQRAVVEEHVADRQLGEQRLLIAPDQAQDLSRRPEAELDHRRAVQQMATQRQGDGAIGRRQQKQPGEPLHGSSRRAKLQRAAVSTMVR